MNKPSLKAQETAQTLALLALSFLFSKEEALMFFIQTTGIDTSDMHQLATQKHFQAGVLDFFLSDEKLLLEFAAQERVKPEAIARAAHDLGGGIWESEWA